MADGKQNKSEAEREIEGLAGDATKCYKMGSQLAVYSNNEVIRIVILGKTGAGKSATGNTILGQKSFKSELSAKSLTEECDKVYCEMDGQKVAVIDTPGLFDTNNSEEETVKNIIQCIAYASPGPHIFLVIIRLGTFTEEEKQTVQKIQEIFGEDAYKYSMVLFTHGDQLKGKPIEEFMKESEDLQELVAKCNNQYHVFNNELEDRSQVRELLEKIRNINKKNGGNYYTNEMFQKAERAIEEREKEILIEIEEETHKEEEEMMKEIDEEYQPLLRDVKGDKEKGKKLMEERAEKIKNKMKKLREKVKRKARKLAEEHKQVFKVKQLLKKIRNINMKNGGNYYPTKMFQRAERAIKEKKQQILKDNEEQMFQEQEELMMEREENIDCCGNSRLTERWRIN